MLLQDSLYFGFTVTLGFYMLGSWMKQKTGWMICNPLLITVIVIILCLSGMNIPYQTYYEGAKYISYFLTPVTVCLAIPLYKQLRLLRQNLTAVVSAIFAGVMTNAIIIFLLCVVFQLEQVHYVTLLPKSITTAIGMGVSEEAGGIVSITVMCIMITGLFGGIFADVIFKLTKITHPIAKGLALGTASHAIGTSKAIELGEIETAMSSLSIAVAGLLTVVVVPLMLQFTHV